MELLRSFEMKCSNVQCRDLVFPMKLYEIITCVPDMTIHFSITLIEVMITIVIDNRRTRYNQKN